MHRRRWRVQSPAFRRDGAQAPLLPATAEDRFEPHGDLVLLKHRLAALHLPTIKAESEQVARQCVSENTDCLGFLLRLCERELADRERRACARRLWPSPPSANLDPSAALPISSHIIKSTRNFYL